MKIAICTVGPNLDSQVSPVFGRSPFFLIFDLKTKKTKSISNPGIQAFRGAGIVASQTLVSERVEAVIAGNFGPNAFSVLKMSKIKLYPVLGVTAREAIEEYQKGNLKEVISPIVPPGFGRGGRRWRHRHRGR